MLVETIEKKQEERAQEQSVGGDGEVDGNQKAESAEEAESAAAADAGGNEEQTNEVNVTQNSVSF